MVHKYDAEYNYHIWQLSENPDNWDIQLTLRYHKFCPTIRIDADDRQCDEHFDIGLDIADVEALINNLQSAVDVAKGMIDDERA